MSTLTTAGIDAALRIARRRMIDAFDRFGQTPDGEVYAEVKALRAAIDDLLEQRNTATRSAALYGS
jgi:hypothetical protein